MNLGKFYNKNIKVAIPNDDQINITKRTGQSKALWFMREEITK